MFSLTPLLERYLLLAEGSFIFEEMYASSILQTLCLFLWFVTARRRQPSVLSKLGERDSLYIYAFHPMSITFFRLLAPLLPAWGRAVYAWAAPLLFLATTMVLIAVLRRCRVVK